MKTIFFIIANLVAFQVLSMESRRRVFGDYQVIVKLEKWDEDVNYERIVVTHRGRRVYSEGELGTYYWIGNHFDASLKENDPYSGKDLTGNGVPDLILTKWNGGAHCCNFLSVFELTETGIKKTITVDGGSYHFKIKDFDGDHFPEIEFWDWPIDYLFNSFADSAQGRVVLKFIDGKYHVASSLMYSRRPNNKKLLMLKDKIRANFKDMGDRVPYELLNIMMELSYTGYKELALKIAEETWPKERTDFKTFKREFSNALKDSKYWSEFNIGKY